MNNNWGNTTYGPGFDAQAADPEMGYAEPFGFKQANVRLGFIRKVLLIVLAQLAVTLALVTCAVYSREYQFFVLRNFWLRWMALAGTLVSFIPLACVRDIARSVPLNYALLALFTLSEGCLVSFAIPFHRAHTVFFALFLTAMVTGALTLYAMTTKTDFTMMGGMLCVASIALLGVGLLAAVFRVTIFQLAVSTASLVLFGVYLVYDIQLITAQGQNRYSVDDYIMAALGVYIDIVQIFMEILRILSIIDNSR